MNIAHDDPRNITVLVTGVSGFLAGHTALQLLKQGYRVRGSLRRIGKRDDVRDQLRSHIHPAGLDKLSFVEADLNSDAGWDAAVEGCRFVIHTASPFPPGYPENEDALIRTARDGALRVLRAAHRASIKRVVLTSSIAATNHGDGQAPFTEENWTDPKSPRSTPYYKSKTLAERAAWAFAREVDLDLAVIMPSDDVPDELVRTMAQTNSDARIIVHELGRDLNVSAAKAQRVLKWHSRPEEECICASAQSLIDLGLVPALGEAAVPVDCGHDQAWA